MVSPFPLSLSAMTPRSFPLIPSLVIPLNRAGWWIAGSPLSEVPAPELQHCKLPSPHPPLLLCLVPLLTKFYTRSFHPDPWKLERQPHHTRSDPGMCPLKLLAFSVLQSHGLCDPSHSILKPHLKSPNPSNRCDLISTLIVDQFFVISLLGSLPIRMWFWIPRTFSAQRISRQSNSLISNIAKDLVAKMYIYICT